MTSLYLTHLQLKTFTEQDVLDYCQINNINSNNIIQLFLWNNELTDISGVKLFKNVKHLYLENNNIIDISVVKNLNKLQNLDISNNQITDISSVQYLNNLQFLNISNLELKSDQIQYINSLKNLETLLCKNGFEDMSILNELKKNIEIYKYE